MKNRGAQRKNGRETPLRIRLAADIGGTFTDVAGFDSRTGQLLFGKTLTTAHLASGIGEGVDKTGVRFGDTSIFLHGSTIAINTMLERTGAKTALVITEGFRDIYEIGRINRPDSYNLFFRKHRPLVDRSMCFEIRERVGAEGEILIPLDESQLNALGGRLKELGVEAVAILLLHSYRNPAHEMCVKRVLSRSLPEAFITASHELSQEYREFERCSTTVANAFIGPRVRNYICEIDRHLEDANFRGLFLLVQSTGGLYASPQAQRQCIRMLESGPAAGVIGTGALCHQLRLQNAIAFDMGGTSAKAGVIYKGKALTTGTALVGGYNQALPVQIPMIDIFEVGTGGGSIAAVDSSGELRVGPQSAGAEPGPACYSRGGMLPTVTDANLLLGRLSADHFLGGEMRLDGDLAARAMEEKVADPLGLSLEQAAEGVLRIAVTAMSYAVKGVSTQRGLDAAAFPLIAYGGAGPLHASAIARELGMRKVIIPRSPGHFCAFGMLFADLRYDYVRTKLMRLTSAPCAEIECIYQSMIGEGRHAVASSGVETASAQIERAADMRYLGQEHSVTIDLSSQLFERHDIAGIKRRFDEVHHLRYGTSAPSEEAEIVSLRVTVTAGLKKPRLERIAKGGHVPYRAAVRGMRRVYFSETRKYVKTRVFARNELRASNRIDGPALIEEHASTTVLLPGDHLQVDEFGNLVIEVGGGRR